LLYREKHAHHIKTNVHGDGAQHPDRVLIRRERQRTKKKKADLADFRSALNKPKRGWPKGRKLQSRPMRG
jgi:hypothetical protein